MMMTDSHNYDDDVNHDYDSLHEDLGDSNDDDHEERKKVS